MRFFVFCNLASSLALACAACGSSSSTTPGTSPNDAGEPISLGDASALPMETEEGGGKPTVDGGFPIGDGAVVRVDRFATRVISFMPGDCAGFGAAKKPNPTLGPPIGGGDEEGSLDVLSLGNGGEIVLSFEPNAIVDGPGTDFLVFENPFLIGGNAMNPTAQPGEVSVSDDGETWKTYPCTATAFPYGACAGWHTVKSNPENGISPVDPAVAGGDPFDLKDVGLTTARFVRIRDKSTDACPPNPNKVTTNGFDLDAISIVNAMTP